MTVVLVKCSMNSPNGQQCLAKAKIDLNQSLTHGVLKHCGNEGQYGTYLTRKYEKSDGVLTQDNMQFFVQFARQ